MGEYVIKRARLSPLKQTYVDHYDCWKSLKQFTDHYQRDSVKAYHRRELFEVGVAGRMLESELCGRIYRIEYRYPMLDVPLVELAYNMPSHLKIHHGMERYMFRRILEGVTTQRIQWRNKADVNLPVFDHSQHTDPDHIFEQLLDSDLAKQYFDRTKLEALARLSTAQRDLQNLKLLLDIEKLLQETGTKITTSG